LELDDGVSHEVGERHEAVATQDDSQFVYYFDVVQQVLGVGTHSYQITDHHCRRDHAERYLDELVVWEQVYGKTKHHPPQTIKSIIKNERFRVRLQPVIGRSVLGFELFFF